MAREAFRWHAHRDIIGVDNPQVWRINCSQRSDSAFPPSLRLSYSILRPHTGAEREEVLRANTARGEKKFQLASPREDHAQALEERIMKRLMVGTGFVVLLLSAKSHAQSGAVTPPAEGRHASQASCVILTRMGRIGRTESRLYHFGISGKQFRYVEGKLPEGFSFHDKMSDHDVRNLQSRGAEVRVLESHYTSEDLKEAKASCGGETSKTQNQVEAKAALAPAPPLIASTSAPAPKPSAAKAPIAKEPTPKAEDSVSSTGATEAALVDVSSTPTGAEVYIDERFFGRTPATTIILMPGSHKIAVKKDGFAVWQRKLKLSSGRVNVDVALLPKAK